MELSTREMSVQAEFASLQGYLRDHLSDEQLSHPLIFSASQWEICTSAIAEIASTMFDMSLDCHVALWSNKTPMRDVGWTTSHILARASFSPARDARVRTALRRFGLPSFAFPSPPIPRWRPRGHLPKVQGLTRSAIRRLEYRGAPLGRAIVQVLPDSQTPSNDHHEWPQRWVEASIESYAYVFDQVCELIASTNRSNLVVFNGRFLHDAAASAAAKRSGIPTLFFDYGGEDTDFDLTVQETHDWSSLQNRMKVMYENWDPRERDVVGGAWFEQRRDHLDASSASFTDGQRLGHGIAPPPGKKVVVFFSSSGDEIAELDVDWGDYFYGQERALEAIVRACRGLEETYVVVRTHPHKRIKARQDLLDWDQAVGRAAPDLHLDAWSDVDSYTLMEQADVVVTFGSTTGVEAGYARRPVIVMGPSAYDELGCAQRVRTEKELQQAIVEASVGDWSGAVSYGLMMKRRGFKNNFVTNFKSQPSLMGQALTDAHQSVMKICHWWAKRQNTRLIER